MVGLGSASTAQIADRAITTGAQPSVHIITAQKYQLIFKTRPSNSQSPPTSKDEEE